jgi:predicted nucleic-acid-binding Zn-ribbon protein
MDMTSPAPPCPECGGARFWYGSVEFWVGGTSHRSDDRLDAAVCGDCGYSSLYLANMAGLRQALASGSGQPARNRSWARRQRDLGQETS